MTTQEIADRLVALCREGKYEQAQRELYSQEAKSIEPAGNPGMQTVQGLDAIIEKGNQFQAMIQELHGGSVDGPLVAGNQIALTISLDATFKDGNRMNMNEIAVYTVQDGKIVQEQFFY
ncbi:nuclear transport factor 2 family protein [Spirosoma sp. KNUC1025]|uniref:nuclear transport factor 2 family protein n=1 Tax=Spirosoma sp. KNUC1025 TaxID=2894082 RepID=UPI00386E6A05|nr:nuclear transport factor 2 family protein [Spirosoma sp. KNUC1025]